MTKRIVCLVLALCLIAAVPLAVSAASPRLAQIIPIISFKNGYANCTVDINAIGDSITGIIKLWEDGSCIRTWNVSGDDELTLERSVPATSGKTYYLTIAVTLSGNPRAPVSSTPVTCP